MCVPQVPCKLNAGRTFGNDVLGFTGSKWTIAADTAPGGKRTYTKVDRCPAPKAEGTWMDVIPSETGGCPGCKQTNRVVVDGKGQPHLFATANGAISHYQRAKCGWKSQGLGVAAEGYTDWDRDLDGNPIGVWSISGKQGVLAR